MTVKCPRSLFSAVLLLTLFAFGCGASSSSGNNKPIVSTPGAAPSSTVFVVVMENKNYTDVVGSATMPYFNSLVAKGALATQYYADVHPSIGNYLIMTTGLAETLDDSFTGVITNDNIARDLVSNGKTWKAYAESIPSAGYLGPDAYPYVRRHNVFTFFSDVQNNPAQASNIVPLSQLSTDLASGQLPNLAFIIPNVYGEGHDCLPNTTCNNDQQLAQIDGWLQSNLPAILNSASLQGSGVLAITWDESGNDFTNGGGRVPTLFLGAQVKPGYQSTSSYQHQDLLRMICARLGLSSGPGGAARASTMSEFFQ